MEIGFSLQFRDESLARKNIIMINLNTSMKTNTSVDEWLFGGDLEEKIKLAKNPEKITKTLKPPLRFLQQSNTQRNAKKRERPAASTGLQEPNGDVRATQNIPEQLSQNIELRYEKDGSSQGVHRIEIVTGGDIKSINQRR